VASAVRRGYGECQLGSESGHCRAPAGRSESLTGHASDLSLVTAPAGRDTGAVAECAAINVQSGT